MPQLRMDAVAATTMSLFRNGAVRERNARHVIDLCTAGATMASVHHVAAQRGGQDFDKVGAVHSERGVPARRVRYLHRRNRTPVVTQILRAKSDPGSQPFD